MKLVRIDARIGDEILPNGNVWITMWMPRAQFDLIPGKQAHHIPEPGDSPSWHKSYSAGMIDLDAATWEVPIPPNALVDD